MLEHCFELPGVTEHAVVGGYALVLRFDVVSGLSCHRKLVVPPTMFLKQVYWYGYQLC